MPAEVAPRSKHLPTITTLNAFTQTTWSREDGAPALPRAVAQTPDGKLYVSGLEGLFRFDGVSFEPVPTARGVPFEHATPTSLLTTASGELWLGYAGGGGVGVLRHGLVVDAGLTAPPTEVSLLVQTSDGAVWAGYGGDDRRLARFANGRWIDAAKQFGLPPGAILSLVDGPDGSLWASMLGEDGAKDYLVYLPKGGTRFLPSPIKVAQTSLAFDPLGRLWGFDRRKIRILRDEHGNATTSGPTYPSPPNLRYVSHAAFDRFGGMWGTTMTGGFLRVAEAARASSVPGTIETVPREKLGTDTTLHTIADRAGNIWLATARSVVRYRRAALIHEPGIPHENSQDGMKISGTADGRVEIVSSGKLFEIAPGMQPRVARSDIGDAFVICPARNGGTWVGVGDHMERVGVGATRTPPVPKQFSFVQDCGEDAHGRLWLNIVNGVGWLDGTGWHRLQGLPPQSDVYDIAIGADGDAYYTLNRTSLVRLSQGGPKQFGPGALKIGGIASIAPTPSGMIVAGRNGLARVQGDRVQHLDPMANPWSLRVRSVIQTQGDRTWIQGSDGIAMVSTRALDRAFATSDNVRLRLPVRTFNADDGVEEFVQHAGVRGAQTAYGSDGRLWFLSTEGVAYLDTGHLPFDHVPPPVAVTSLSSQSGILRDPSDATLPAGTKSVEIAYSEYGLTMPERAQFRYRLDGIDQGWVDPGRRREAPYANLGPGRYVFHVIAANGDGVWNREGATLRFSIRPTFVQSWPFKLLVIVVLCALGWMAYSLRLRAAAGRLKLLMDERIRERERIARELHDTLLQAVHVLMMRVQVAARELPERSPSRVGLEAALDDADDVIAEGRDRVRDLRKRLLPSRLEEAIAASAGRRALSPGTAFDMSSQGEPRRLVPAAIDGIVDLISEALRNAAIHSRASRVAVRVAYRASGLRIDVEDDGIGISPEILDAGGRGGHYGLPGMFERAAVLGGRLEISTPAKGTTIQLTVPSSAYSR